jgi:hypothetical protein
LVQANHYGPLSFSNDWFRSGHIIQFWPTTCKGRSIEGFVQRSLFFLKRPIPLIQLFGVILYVTLSPAETILASA